MWSWMHSLSYLILKIEKSYLILSYLILSFHECVRWKNSLLELISTTQIFKILKVCKGWSELVNCNLPFEAILLGQCYSYLYWKIGTFQWRIAKNCFETHLLQTLRIWTLFMGVKLNQDFISKSTKLQSPNPFIRNCFVIIRMPK